MPKFFIRSIALLLVPCLIADPSFAQLARPDAWRAVSAQEEFTYQIPTPISQIYEAQTIVAPFYSSGPRITRDWKFKRLAGGVASLLIAAPIIYHHVIAPAIPAPGRAKGLQLLWTTLTIAAGLAAAKKPVGTTGRKRKTTAAAPDPAATLSAEIDDSLIALDRAYDLLEQGTRAAVQDDFSRAMKRYIDAQDLTQEVLDGTPDIGIHPISGFYNIYAQAEALEHPQLTQRAFAGAEEAEALMKEIARLREALQLLEQIAFHEEALSALGAANWKVLRLDIAQENTISTAHLVRVKQILHDLESQRIRKIENKLPAFNESQKIARTAFRKFLTAQKWHEAVIYYALATKQANKALDGYMLIQRTAGVEAAVTREAQSAYRKLYETVKNYEQGYRDAVKRHALERAIALLSEWGKVDHEEYISVVEHVTGEILADPELTHYEKEVHWAAETAVLMNFADVELAKSVPVARASGSALMKMLIEALNRRIPDVSPGFKARFQFDESIAVRLRSQLVKAFLPKANAVLLHEIRQAAPSTTKGAEGHQWRQNKELNEKLSLILLYAVRQYPEVYGLFIQVFPAYQAQIAAPVVVHTQTIDESRLKEYIADLNLIFRNKVPVGRITKWMIGNAFTKLPRSVHIGKTPEYAAFSRLDSTYYTEDIKQAYLDRQKNKPVGAKDSRKGFAFPELLTALALAAMLALMIPIFASALPVQRLAVPAAATAQWLPGMEKIRHWGNPALRIKEAYNVNIQVTRTLSPEDKNIYLGNIETYLDRLRRQGGALHYYLHEIRIVDGSPELRLDKDPHGRVTLTVDELRKGTWEQALNTGLMLSLAWDLPHASADLRESYRAHVRRAGLTDKKEIKVFALRLLMEDLKDFLLNPIPQAEADPYFPHAPQNLDLRASAADRYRAMQQLRNLLNIPTPWKAPSNRPANAGYHPVHPMLSAA